MSKVIGGNAFPSNFSRERGMSLRDYFAALAIQGWLSSFSGEEAHPSSVGTELQIAREAYKIADAMLKARNE